MKKDTIYTTKKGNYKPNTATQYIVKNTKFQKYISKTKLNLKQPYQMSSK